MLSNKENQIMVIGIRVLIRLFINLLSSVLFVFIVHMSPPLDDLIDDVFGVDGTHYLNFVSIVFCYYFIGLVISLCGSFIIEPVLKRIGWIKWCDPQDYFGHSEETKLNIEFVFSSEKNNMYRTLFTLFFIILLLICYSIAVDFDSDKIRLGGLCSGLMVLFFFFYRKQSNFIRKEIENNKK